MDIMMLVMEIVQGKFQHCPFIVFPPKSRNLKIAILVIRSKKKIQMCVKKHCKKNNRHNFHNVIISLDVIFKHFFQVYFKVDKQPTISFTFCIDGFQLLQVTSSVG